MTNTTIKTLLLTMAAIPAICEAQSLSGDGYAQKMSDGGEDVYLYTRSASPTLTFTSAAETTLNWYFSADGSSTTEPVRTTESVKSDVLTVDAAGFYTVVTADGVTLSAWMVSPSPVSTSFVIDSVNCDAVFAKATSEAPAITFGSHTLAQKITYQWEVADSTVLTTQSEIAEIEDIYDEGLLTLRAINQAFNEATCTDSVMPQRLRASYSYTSRKTDIANEATATGDALSAPAEVALNNSSLGTYTVCEWAIGNIARLYDKQPVYQFQQPGTYTITLTITNEETGCASTDSSMTVTVSEAALEFPNAFTPNGDGVNDRFMPSFRSLSKYELTIWNRWGHRVFETKDPSDGWDGTINGKEAAAGTYYFMSTASGYEKGVTFRRKGSVTLVR